jgi:hypothetical protein
MLYGLKAMTISYNSMYFYLISIDLQFQLR